MGLVSKSRRMKSMSNSRYAHVARVSMQEEVDERCVAEVVTGASDPFLNT